MKTTKHHIFLIPGFFGFANLGGLLYFAHVVEFLAEACRELGLDVKIHRVPTNPTASLPRRTVALLQAIAATEAGEHGHIHLIGHSSGGLDARLLATPHVSLPTTVDVDAIARRIRTIVTVSTPHHGTPLSTFLTTLFGKQLLRALSLSTIYVLRFGHLPISVVVKLGAMLTRIDDRLGLSKTVADQIFTELLGDFSPDRRRELRQFLEATSAEQGLLPQLTPEGAEVFNASASDRASVRYGSVVSMTGRPGIRSVWRAGIDPYAQLTHMIFAGLYRVTIGPKGALPPLSLDDASHLRRWLPRVPQPGDSDGVVPTVSQVWGEIICASHADHLDVIGHFGDEQHDPPHYDWLASGSGFNRPHFEQLWAEVARFIARQ